MNNISPIIGDSTQQNALIYHELSKIGRPGHERIAFTEEGTPSTTAKPNWLGRLIEYIFKFPSQRLQSIIDKTLKFFEDNHDFSAGRSHCLKLLEPVIRKTKNADLLKRYQALTTPLDQALDLLFREKITILEKKLVDDHNKIKSKLQSDFALQEANLKEKLKTLANNTEETLLNIQSQIYYQEMKVQFALQALTDLAKKRMSLLDGNIQILDTVLSGTDGKISLPWSLLLKIQSPFFSSLQADRNTYLSQHQEMPFPIEFKEVTKLSLELFAYFLLTTSLPTKALKTNEIINLYDFAKLLNFDFIRIVISYQLGSQLSPDEAKHILTQDKYKNDFLGKAAEDALEYDRIRRLESYKREENDIKHHTI